MRIRTIFVLALGILLISIGLFAQTPSDVTTQEPIALAPPPVAWLVIYPRDGNDQGFTQPPARILVGRNTPDDLEICVERATTVCFTIGQILAATTVAPPAGQ